MERMEGTEMCAAIDGIREELFTLQDTTYREFQQKLFPMDQELRIIGVRTPALRKLAGKLYGTEEASEFLRALPHTYFDENQLHAFLLSLEKDAALCFSCVDQFLPYVDNWATCDQMSPKIFKKHKEEVLAHVRTWIASAHTYTVRFAIGMLMQHFLDADFEPVYPEMVAAVRSEEYYINMEIAWYFATALAKQWDAVLPYLKERRLAPWTHNKTIQKAVESYRITDERKGLLREMRIRRESAPLSRRTGKSD